MPRQPLLKTTNKKPSNTACHPTIPPLTYASVDPDKPLQCPFIEYGGSARIASIADLPELCLKGASNILYGVYRWENQNLGNHLDGIIK